MRRRWLSAGFGCLLGIPIGMLSLFLFMLISVRAIQTIRQIPSGPPAVTIAIEEDYLNSEATRQIGGNYPTGVDALTITGLHIDANPDNRMDMSADFKIDLGFINVTTSAGITNRIAAQDGKIVINMEGRPQIGNLTIPIDALPFDLSANVTKAIDRVNNDVLAKQLNDMLEANLAGTSLYLDSVTTDTSTLTLHLKQK